MSSQPRLSQLDLWGRHAISVMAVLLHALSLLAADWPAGLHIETEMTRELYLRILTARRLLETAGEWVPEGLPCIDGRNAPTPDTAGTSSERTLPDLQWGFQDSFEPDPYKSARWFHIECKRIGGSDLNEKYVDEGVQRFVSPGHRYGKDVSEGAMVGYIIEGRAADAISDVNGRAAVVGLPEVVLISDAAHVALLESTLDRSFPRSPFKLHHAWVLAASAPSTKPESTIGNAPPEMSRSVTGSILPKH
jgi:hypothetical protein